MHAFSGNDYVSSFFRKGKIAVWKKILSNPEFVDIFGSLGDFNYEEFERFVCALYGYPKHSSVDKVLAWMVINKFKKDNQIYRSLQLTPLCCKLTHAF